MAIYMRCKPISPYKLCKLQYESHDINSRDHSGEVGEVLRTHLYILTKSHRELQLFAIVFF